MKTRLTLVAVAISIAALSLGGTANAAPLTLDPATPDAATQIADSGSASSLSSSGGSSNVLGTGSSVSQLLSAGLCTITGGTWVPVFDVCIH
ncbi:hypothetical protein ACFYUD_06145 [Nocardia tengchongensis]|uniref:hypothetical protein n=1 Tax=Nocardia tengchongensis TaxID=2055889 RepID=UPI0036A031A1